jgi:uncharacterized protein (DUF2267 family)
MGYADFLATVEREANASRAAAELATRATLQTLGQRINKGEVQDLAEALPAELVPWVFSDRPGQAFDGDEFLRRVAEIEKTDVVTAERHARGVFAALRRILPAAELGDLKAELPAELSVMFTELPWLTGDEFVQQVAKRAGIDARRAVAVTDAVLETLAERFAPGEVDDLISRLPVELDAPLERGRHRADERTQRMSVGPFLRRVVARCGCGIDEARDYTRAVLETLRDAVPEEYFDAIVELPPDYEIVRPLPAERRYSPRGKSKS